MDMNWFESMIFGFVSGLTEFLPVSSQAHEALMLKLFGAADSPLLRVLVHAAVWEALYLSLRTQIDHMRAERELADIPPRRRTRQPDQQKVLDLRLLKTALIPLLLGFLAYPALSGWRNDLSKAAIFLLVNGVIVYIPRHLRGGNKDSRSMTGLDSVFFGICGAAAVLPGISRVGVVASAGVGRGADKEHALRWALMLDLAALMFIIGFDLYALYLSGAGEITMPVVLSCILAVASAFGGATVGIYMMRFLAVRVGFAGFAYYSWGAALFAFLMYLTI